MANTSYYADISNSYSGIGDGSSGSPWSYGQTISGPILGDGDTLYIKGHRVANGTYPNLYFVNTNSYGSPNPTVKAWNRDTYGPYIYEAPSGTVSLFYAGYNQKYTTEDAIIIADTIAYSPTVSTPSLELKSCILYGDFSYLKDNGSSSDIFNCCTFASGTFTIADYTASESGNINIAMKYCLLLNYPFIEPVSTTYKGEGKIVLSGCTTTLTESGLFSGLAYITHQNYENVYSASSGLLTQFPHYTGLSSGDLVNSGNLRYENYDLAIPHITGWDMRSDWYGNFMGGGWGGVGHRGYGAFYFSPYIYTDLNATGFNGLGTSTSPISSDYFKYYIQTNISYANVGNGDTFRIKGSYNDNSNTEFKLMPLIIANPTVYFEGWNMASNGPWTFNTPSGFKIGSLTGGSFVIKDMLLDSLYLRSDQPSTYFFNSYFRLPSQNANNVIYSAKFYGCTFVKDGSTDNYLGILAYGPAIYKDCVFIGSGITFRKIYGDPPPINLSAIFTDCVFEAPNSGLLISSGGYPARLVLNFSGCQFGWNASSFSSWPTYTGVKNDFKYSVLGSGINISGTGTWTY